MQRVHQLIEGRSEILVTHCGGRDAGEGRAGEVGDEHIDVSGLGD